MTRQSASAGLANEAFRWLTYLALAHRASLLAMAVAILTFLILGPLALLPPIIFFVLLIGLPMAYIFSTPVTFVLLPLIALFLRSQPTIKQIVLPLVGLAGGAFVTWLEFRLGTTTGRFGTKPGDLTIVIIGAISGLAAGIFYAKKLGTSHDNNS
jgi:hypothetical protein